jgi:hypothetical protein
LLASDKPKTLSAIVEGDETFILKSFKGKRSGMARQSRKRGGKSAKRGLSAEQIPVIVARDRRGATTDAVLPRLNRVSIAAVLDSVVTPANEFCCDGGTAIVAFARRAGIAANQTQTRRTFTSTTSTPVMAGRRNGCVAAMASPRKTYRTIPAGGEPWRRWDSRSHPKR